MTKVAIATTTIFPLRFLPAYADNLLKYGRTGKVTIYIAGDRKSPAGCLAEADVQKRRGVDVRYLPIEVQGDYLARFPELAHCIPENSDNRRNVAFLMALEEGADIVISIDDDNYCLPDVDFVEEHMACGSVRSHPEAVGAGGWYNPCALLVSTTHDTRLYPRGFPYRKRVEGTDELADKTAGRIGINVGLWMGDPDVDAVGRLHARPWVSAWNQQSVLLGRGIRCPINTQNTSLTREAMAAYYYVRMNEPMRGLVIDRFGDIFSGYFAQVCADAVGDRIRIGPPIVDHRRNPHNIFLDLFHELAGMMILEDLACFLSTIQPPVESYSLAYNTLSYKIEEFAQVQEGFIWQKECKDFFTKIARNMRIWSDVVKSIS